MPTTRTTVVLIVLALLVVGAGAYLFFGAKDEPSSSAVSITGAPASEAELTFIHLTAQIEPITFDTSMLSDPRFLSLVDLRTAILPETAGRQNPFAPLPGVSAE